MAEVINLNKFRKQKARDNARQQAAENRVRFGRTKAEKAHDEAQTEDAQRKLDNLRREPGADGAAEDPDVQP